MISLGEKQSGVRTLNHIYRCLRCIDYEETYYEIKPVADSRLTFWLIVRRRGRICCSHEWSRDKYCF